MQILIQNLDGVCDSAFLTSVPWAPLGVEVLNGLDPRQAVIWVYPFPIWVEMGRPRVGRWGWGERS